MEGRGIQGFRRSAVGTRTARSCPTRSMLNQLPRRVFHLAEEANFPSIQRNGLLSASALLDLAGIIGEERTRLEQRQRLLHINLPNGTYLRDQRPMPPQALAHCLIGMEPADWYGLINSKVFFWLDPDRLNRQRQACEPRPQIVLVVDTERLLARHAKRIALSPFNTGNAHRKPAVRGRSTFVPFERWVESGWDSEAPGVGSRSRSRSHRPVELTIEGTVSDIMDLVVRVCRLGPGESLDIETSPISSRSATVSAEHYLDGHAEPIARV
jgi:hypothetical protein